MVKRKKYINESYVQLSPQMLEQELFSKTKTSYFETFPEMRVMFAKTKTTL